MERKENGESSKFEKLEKELKSTIFGVLFILLKTEEKSEWKYLLTLGIEFSQLMAFPFSKRVMKICILIWIG
jgi:hypothetical protein